MIIHDNFAIGFIPRTGTDACTTYFQHLQRYGLNTQITPHIVMRHNRFAAKHLSFVVREIWRKPRDLILTFRRLPNWILSYIHHLQEMLHIPSPDKHDILERKRIYGFYYYDQCGHPTAGSLANAGDRWLRYMTADDALPISHFLRMENLLPEIIEFARHYATLPDNIEEEMLTLPTKNRMSYDHDLDHWFTKQEIATIYKNNPQWMYLEKKIYGNLLL